MLSQHKASIKTLTQEFTLDAIAAVAKQLLDDNVFGSQSRARLRFPELFETSKTREAERKASEANVAKFEAEAIHENLVTSDEEWEEEVVENCTSQGQRVIPFVQRQSVDQNSYRDFTAADR